MNLRCLLAAISLTFCFGISAQNILLDSLINSADDIYNASIKTKCLIINLSNPEESELALKKVHTYRLLETIIIEGNSDETDFKKLFSRLSFLKNLTSIILKDNDLTTIPENISSIKTLKSLTIQENRQLDFNDLFKRLNAAQLEEINLIDNDIKGDIPAFSQLTSIKKINISGSEKLNYENLIDQLEQLPYLTSLAIPVNYISELPQNIAKLKNLQVLDVGNNLISQFPDNVSSLKAINNLSIQGNLILSPSNELEKFSENDFKYLSLDKEISEDELEKIKKMFPNVEINYPNEIVEEPIIDTINKSKPAIINNYEGELKSVKQSIILSPAYLSYAALFNGLDYNFDTLSFEERYLDAKYSNVFPKRPSAITPRIYVYLRTKLNRNEEPGKKEETWFHLPDNYNNYPELKAFNGMYWVYEGELSKKQFYKKYVEKKNFFFWKTSAKWDDIRIEIDKNNSLFIITLKKDSLFEKFKAYPVLPNTSDEKTQKTYNYRYINYKNQLAKRSQTFKKDLAREKKRNDANYKKLVNAGWKELKLRMSDKEKLMPREEWLEYYDNIIFNEKEALNNSPLTQSNVLRGFVVRDYRTPVIMNPGIQQPNNNNEAQLSENGYLNLNVDFIEESTQNKLPVITIYILDKKNKLITQYQGMAGLSATQIVVKQYANYSIIVELRNGDYGVISDNEINAIKIEPYKIYQLKTKVVDKNLETIGELMKIAGL